ncbi:sporulation protein, partial [Stenotrophomonas maltophilia]
MDTPLKQRLIGAIVLVALAVIFLPMLVKGPAPDSGVASVPIAAPDAPADGQFETRELPLVAPAGGATGLQTGQAKPLQEAATPATPPTVDTSPAVAAGNYAVTFGAYGSKADADAVIAYLQRSQLPGFAEATTINGRQAWRVRVGPYADRAQAEAARLQAVKIRADVKAEVITLDAATGSSAPVAATPAPAPAPATPSASTPSAATSPSASSNPVRSESLPPTATATPAAKPEPPKPEAPKSEPKPEATASK